MGPGRVYMQRLLYVCVCVCVFLRERENRKGKEMEEQRMTREGDRTGWYC